MTSRFENIHGEQGHIILVAADEKDVAVGWIHGRVVRWLESDPFVDVGGMVVADSSRGQGVGGRLLDEVENWARSLGHRRIRIRSNVVRERAHGFYTRLGYDKVKTSYVFEKTLE
jgi:GNAT superfamily N-acetyltransferase